MVNAICMDRAQGVVFWLPHRGVQVSPLAGESAAALAAV